MENDVCPLSPRPSGSPGRRPPNRAPTKRDAPFLEPSTYLLKFPINGLPQVPQQAPTERGTHLQSFLLDLSLKVPSKWAPPPCSPTGSPWREKLHLHSQWFFLSLMSVRVPNNEPSHEKLGKHLVTVHGAPCGRKASFPKGIVYDTAVSTPVPCSLQHDTFRLGLGRPEPC